MKLKRYKKIRKILHSYQITHHIVPPYKVACDGEFLQAALAGQIMLREQMPKMLQEERTTCYVTPCIDNWLRLKGGPYSGALHISKSLPHLKCRHEKGFVRPFECIKHLVHNGNPDRLLIAAQDEPIRKLIRHTPGVPLILIHGSTMLMESPTDTTKEDHEAALAARTKIEKEEQKRIQQAAKELKQEEQAAAASSSSSHGDIKPKPKLPSSASSSKKRKLKGPSQPNPLSVKKKKKGPTPPSNKKKAVKTEEDQTDTKPSVASSTSASSSSSSSNEPPQKKIKVENGPSSRVKMEASPSSSLPSSKVKTEASSSSSSTSSNNKKRPRSDDSVDEK